MAIILCFALVGCSSGVEPVSDETKAWWAAGGSESVNLLSDSIARTVGQDDPCAILNSVDSVDIVSSFEVPSDLPDVSEAQKKFDALLNACDQGVNPTEPHAAAVSALADMSYEVLSFR